MAIKWRKNNGITYFHNFNDIISSLLQGNNKQKMKKIERDYKYINARLLDIINDSENNYILIPSDIKVVKETAKGINNLLEKFYGRQIDYNRNQK